MRVLVALGGNALLKRGEPMTAEVQRENVRVAARALAPVCSAHQLVLSHGNGPQVGLLALQASAYKEVEAYPLDVLGAQTEGMIGYLIEQELGNLLPAEVPLATILTMVEVDRDDPAFHEPTKFVGPIYDDADAEALAKEKGWTFKRDGELPPPRRGVACSEADLRDPADPVAARPRHGRDLRRRWRHPHVLGGGQGTHARRDRSCDRQGSRQRVARTRDRCRSVRDGDRRGRRLRELGDARATQARHASPRNRCGRSTSPPGRWGPRSRPRRCSSSTPASEPRSAHSPTSTGSWPAKPARASCPQQMQ